MLGWVRFFCEQRKIKHLFKVLQFFHKTSSAAKTAGLVEGERGDSLFNYFQHFCSETICYYKLPIFYVA